MPRPIDSRAKFEPGLDGIRALAVVGVVGYHLGIPALQGGLLGVGVFFTLSGYLITSILLTSWRRHGDLELRRFWTRRARRLLPAVGLLLVAVLIATVLIEPHETGKRAVDSLWAMLYVSNWATILSGVSYFERFGTPGPLDHLWSLAIEEQFYLVWPLVLAAMLRFFGNRRERLAMATLALASASFGLLALLASPGFDNTRAYEGTDTRAGGLLVGAALAMVWRPGRTAKDVSTAASRSLDIVGGLGVVVIAALVATTNDYSMSLYTWVLLALTLATTAVVAVAVHPGSRLVRPALSMPPLLWLGERSYGIYLWHMPVIAFTPREFFADNSWIRGGFQVGVTLCLASMSWALIEDPIRRHGLGAVLQPFARPPTVANPLAADPRPLQAALLNSRATRPALAAVAAVVGLAFAWVVTPGAGDSTDLEVGLGGGVFDVELETTTTAAPTTTGLATTIPPSTTTSTTVPPSGPQTRCKEVVHVGDSTSVGLMSPKYLPDPTQRIDYKYRQAGVIDPFTDISGARSIVETDGTHPNARASVQDYMSKGYDGCWVFAMGTNDTANQFVGSKHNSAERIDRLMNLVGDHPVMWLSVKTLRPNGPYAQAEMQKWNEALGEACKRYPNMRVYNWAGQVADKWYINDGIHFTTEGYKWRSALTAGALATAFPADGSVSPGCYVVPA